MGIVSGKKTRLTLKEAAVRLSDTGEEVSDTDILQLALDGHLRLSVYFIEPVQARRQRLCALSITGPLGNFICGDRKKEVMYDDAEVVELEGVFDLAMIGNEIKNIALEEVKRLTDHPNQLPLPRFERPGIFLIGENNFLYRLEKPYVRVLPTASLLVVRTSEIDELRTEKLSCLGLIESLKERNKNIALQEARVEREKGTPKKEILKRLRRKYGLKGCELHDTLLPEDSGKSPVAKRQSLKRLEE